jgi:hypothetical protein
MIGSLYLRSQYWLYKYAFNKDFDLISITDAPINDTHFIIPFKTQKVLFIADSFVSPKFAFKGQTYYDDDFLVHL